jgi:RNA ligase (TIGR02306 family)
LEDAELDAALFSLGLPRVPVLYRGPFSQPVVATLTDGAETLSGKALHLREGVVIRNQHERQDRRAGRVQLKSVSAAYLLRKGGTELQ